MSVAQEGSKKLAAHFPFFSGATTASKKVRDYWLLRCDCHRGVLNPNPSFVPKNLRSSFKSRAIQLDAFCLPLNGSRVCLCCVQFMCQHVMLNACSAACVYICTAVFWTMQLSMHKVLFFGHAWLFPHLCLGLCLTQVWVRWHLCCTWNGLGVWLQNLCLLESA